MSAKRQRIDGGPAHEVVDPSTKGIAGGGHDDRYRGRSGLCRQDGRRPSRYDYIYLETDQLQR